MRRMNTGSLESSSRSKSASNRCMNTAGIMMSLDPSPLMEKGGTWVVLYCLTLSGRGGGC